MRQHHASLVRGKAEHFLVGSSTQPRVHCGDYVLAVSRVRANALIAPTSDISVRRVRSFAN